MGLEKIIELQDREIGEKLIIQNHIVNSMRLEKENDPSIKSYVFSGIYKYMVANLGDKKHYYPDGWWQFTKEKFFPRWLERMFPIRYKIVSFEALYPGVSLKDFGIQGKEGAIYPIPKMFIRTYQAEPIWRKDNDTDSDD